MTTSHSSTITSSWFYDDWDGAEEEKEVQTSLSVFSSFSYVLEYSVSIENSTFFPIFINWTTIFLVSTTPYGPLIVRYTLMKSKRGDLNIY